MEKQCRGITKSGARCKIRFGLNEEGYCRLHADQQMHNDSDIPDKNEQIPPQPQTNTQKNDTANRTACTHNCSHMMHAVIIIISIIILISYVIVSSRKKKQYT